MKIQRCAMTASFIGQSQELCPILDIYFLGAHWVRYLFICNGKSAPTKIEDFFVEILEKGFWFSPPPHFRKIYCKLFKKSVTIFEIRKLNFVIFVAFIVFLSFCLSVCLSFVRISLQSNVWRVSSVKSHSLCQNSKVALTHWPTDQGQV